MGKDQARQEVPPMLLMNSVKNLKFVSWNVRGLNEKNKRSLVKHELYREKPHLVCLQETKWAQQEPRFVREVVGARYSEAINIGAKDTAGGLMIAWDRNTFGLIQEVVGEYCASVDLVLNFDNTVFRFTRVYGPSDNRDKGPFLLFA